MNGSDEGLQTAKLPSLRESVRPIFVIRGDLMSVTGYGQATRSLASLIRKSFELYGVDIHPDPASDRALFPGPLIDDEAILEMSAKPGAKVFVLNYTPPIYFRYFPFAVNIGCFYWETEAVPFNDPWRELIAGMDHMWAPNDYISSLIKNSGYERPIHVVTWPHNFEAQHSQPGALDDVEAYFIDIFNGKEGVKLPVESLPDYGGSIFLSVKSAAPRKGLPVLLTEWRDYVLGGGTDDILFLKLRLVHNTRLRTGDVQQVVEMVREAGFRLGDKVRIAFIIEDLTATQLNALYRLSDAYVTASYGEGFGGPVVESLLLGTPVIAGRHTGMADLLPVDYPLAFQTEAKVVELRGNPAIYPHASPWELPRRGEIRAALARFSGLDSADLLKLTTVARAHAATFCSQDAVCGQLETFFALSGL